MSTTRRGVYMRNKLWHARCDLLETIPSPSVDQARYRQSIPLAVETLNSFPLPVTTASQSFLRRGLSAYCRYSRKWVMQANFVSVVRSYIKLCLL